MNNNNKIEQNGTMKKAYKEASCKVKYCINAKHYIQYMALVNIYMNIVTLL